MPGADAHLAAIARGERPPQATDWMLAAGRVAVAAFSRRPRPLSPGDRQLLGANLEAHWRKRLLERQLAGVSADEYEAVARRAALDPEVGVVAYRGPRGPVVALLSRTEAVVPEEERGEAWLPVWFVVYSLQGALVTAYMASSLSALWIPEDAVWMRKPSWFPTPS
ncbi:MULTISPECIES: hypothetical protein [unclassified Meiothermus]|uniref:hypothetical protein n=1 Tax=unclassified Meiothermus TaxID=370471 RepID=UPI000D7BF724|nr:MULTISPECIES: hypothetical protein [unclassified Meiothermus]PZA07717.1 hypothetical protein DNA98_05230 [Meiothermus sp. Pnk-1]RYM37486.1 hypothetical protein EWH23_06190 [Meiothermus sp. PNK-Is4]